MNYLSKINKAKVLFGTFAQTKKVLWMVLKLSLAKNPFERTIWKKHQHFPVKGAKIGQSWSESENVTPDGLIKIHSYLHPLTKVENGIAEISIKNS